MTIEELNKMREARRPIIALRREHSEGELAQLATNGYKRQILVCGDTGCSSSGCKKVVDALHQELEAQKSDVPVVVTGCFGLCSVGPIIIVYPEGSFYSTVHPDNIPRIVKEHIVGGKVVKDLLYPETLSANGSILPLKETKFYAKQTRVALRNCGVIDPESVEDYIGNDGYQALAKVLTSMTPDDVIACIQKSGLRGRGGGGFPTGKKWEFAKNSESDQKYVCCNADEGDPGAFMDRSVLEGDPHVIIEAMAIAAYSIGATEGYVYVRAEYPSAVKRLENAIAQGRSLGLLGKDILGSKFTFDIHIRLGAGAFVCGEETALLASIEGFRGEPRSRPPFPAVKGLFGKPTVLNNVETCANIPQIILNGGEWFAQMGTERSKGTKIFALGGKVRNVGPVEIPMGTTLREIVEEIGGGIPGGKRFKAAQTGGPSGGCIPASLIDTPIDYDNLIAIGSMMGSGGLIVMDEDTCMVDIAKFFLEFTVEESCGKCAPCRIGTRRLYQLLEKITSGQGELTDIDKLEELCQDMKLTSLCALGQSSPNPVLSTLKYFRDEYVAHVLEKKCPAGVCKALLSYNIIPNKCKGCTACAKNCPANAITGQTRGLHTVDHDKCVKCGLCVTSCKFDAIRVK